MSDVHRLLQTQITLTFRQASQVLNLNEGAMYRALRAGDVPSIKIGKEYRIPTAKLREMVGLTAEPLNARSEPAESRAAKKRVRTRK